LCTPAADCCAPFADILDKLKEAVRLLEEVAEELQVYLEKARQYFPRLYLLSDDHLLDVLSQTKAPDKVQPYFANMFDGIHKVEFGVDLAVTSMLSCDGERVPLVRTVPTVLAEGRVEVWLSQVLPPWGCPWTVRGSFTVVSVIPSPVGAKHAKHRLILCHSCVGRFVDVG
jgi:hypothetical protein